MSIFTWHCKENNLGFLRVFSADYKLMRSLEPTPNVLSSSEFHANPMSVPKPTTEKQLHIQKLMLLKGHVFWSTEKQTPISSRCCDRKALTYPSLQGGISSLQPSNFCKTTEFQ